MSQALFQALDRLSSLPEFDVQGARQTAARMEDVLPRLTLPRTPKGTKDLKERASLLLWALKHSTDQGNLRHDWELLRPRYSELVRAFGAPQSPSEVTLEGVTYVDGVGFPEGKLEQLAARFNALWHILKGWRRKALRSGMTVRFAAPKEFPGTVSGKYRIEGDVMLVRATPKIFARPSKEYAGLDYILLHELGHRYEHFFPVPLDFDRPEWWTTRYSRTEGFQGSEAFAELFALGALGIRGAWDDVVERFEVVMRGGPSLSRIVEGSIP